MRAGRRPHEAALPPAERVARVAELRAALAYHAHRYFDLDAPEITDEAYDALVRELDALEASHPALRPPPAEERPVGGRPSERLPAWRHDPPLLSLANAWSLADLEGWMRRVRQSLPALPPLRFVCEPKIDGLAVALRYRDGRFSGGATRGDGHTGEDVSDNLNTLDDIPDQLHIPGGGEPPAWLEVRGEVYLGKSAFAACNRARQMAGLPLLITPRNAAAGSLRQVDGAVTASRPLRFCAFQLASCSTPTPSSHLDSLEWLKALGFRPPEPLRVFEAETDLRGLIDFWEATRQEIDLPVDGFVLKLDARPYWQSLGATAHEPRWAIAYKFAGPRATTRLEAIEFQVGRSGRVHPVARLTPVVVDHVTVQRASLHHADWIARHDLRVGDLVEVEQAGGVIPQVVKPVPAARTGEERSFHPPERCPSCRGPLTHEDDGPFERCENAFCPAQRVRQLLHFVSRDGMDIDGIGEAHARALWERGWLRDPSDLYALPATQLATLPRVGPTLALRWRRAMEASAARPLAHVIRALGIPGVGLEGARVLAQACGSLAGLRDLGPEDRERLRSLPGIGEKTAAAVTRFLASARAQRMLDTLIRQGIGGEVRAGEAAHAPRDQRLAGEIFVFTGTLASMTRAQATEAVASRGARCARRVDDRTTRVVVGAKPGRKRDEALRRGIATLDEAGFAALLENTA